MNSNTPKKPFSPLAIAVATVLLGGAMFAFGRSSAPNPPANFSANEAAVTSEADHAPGEAGHEEHAPGEAGHEEHAEGEAGHEEHAEGEAISFSPDALKSAQIEVAPVALRAQVSGLPFNGQIEVSPDNVARVASIVPGRITRLFVSVGQNVRQGQTLATVESRGVGEAQAAYAQAVARLQNARSNLDLTQKQARAGVFSRGPLETARRAQFEAQSEVRAGETAVRQSRAALENITRLAKVGSFARPSLEAARSQSASALENLRSAEAAQSSAGAAVQSARAELSRRRQIAAGGGYDSRPVEAARRLLVAAKSARATAQSEVAATRANLSRAKSLAAEGLVATRDLETAQTAFDTATARLESAQSEERAATPELERQTRLATSNLAGNAEVGEAQARLASAQSDQRTRDAQVQRASEGLRAANAVLSRESAIFGANLANRREFSSARANLENSRNALEKARQSFAVCDAALGRETSIYRQNLNDLAPLQSARATLISAQSDFSAAQSALSLLKSAPGGSAIVPIRAPLAGIVQMRDVAQGEVVEADKHLMTIVNLETVHVDMFLPERDISRVRIGAPVSVRVDAAPNQTFSGRIELIHTELDPKTRTIEAHAELRNPGTPSGYVLRPGMFARGVIGSGAQRLALMIPTDAVQDMEGKRVVFVAGEKAGQFEAREVEIGAATGGQTLIKSGLKAGERAVVKGAFMVKAQAMKAELGHEH